MIDFNPEFDAAALDALMELAGRPGQYIEHPEFEGTVRYDYYSMTPAMFAEEYNLTMECEPGGVFWESYVTENNIEPPRYVDLICRSGVDSKDRQFFIQHWDDGEVTIVLYENDDRLAG